MLVYHNRSKEVTFIYIILYVIIYMQIYIILYKYEYIHIYTHMYIYIHTHIYIYMYVYIRANIIFDEDRIVIMINNSKEINFSGLACT